MHSPKLLLLSLMRVRPQCRVTFTMRLLSIWICLACSVACFMSDGDGRSAFMVHMYRSLFIKGINYCHFSIVSIFIMGTFKRRQKYILFLMLLQSTLFCLSTKVLDLKSWSREAIGPKNNAARNTKMTQSSC